MKKGKRVRKIGKYQWILGFLGFMGFLGFRNFPSEMNIIGFVFFAFFAFFCWFWDYKLQQGVEDERLTENRLKASNIAHGVSLSIIWVGAVLSSNYLLYFFPILTDYKYRYAFLLALIALGFAFGMVFRSYLTYRYDTKA